ncbi:hypothetical protein BD410DRAFT_784226 [Rickenella mellea]|uniref:DUF7904 domain-containing protein n=1 Tax=Rickenella mellea TaxID=50990 RepID=A0A4Y7QGD7_9AGAM|nr:hypothetical protein BD410DRAFT_784226 [Rickenella mellea]
MDSPSRRRTFEHPKPETGLAEWTSRIKALQQEVDADEEAEQRRLEEEIRASRLARSRRSTGMHAESDLSSSPIGHLAEDTNPPIGGVDERETFHANALRRLTSDPSQTPERSAFSRTAPQSSLGSTSAKAMGAQKPEPVSLAAFIGGRATGPRLNRHNPQQDAHDPTQFEQRTRIDAPHPIFGRGGVAMPGLATKGRIPAPLRRDPVENAPRTTPLNQETKSASAELPRERPAVQSQVNVVKENVSPEWSPDQQRVRGTPSVSTQPQHTAQSTTPDSFRTEYSDDLRPRQQQPTTPNKTLGSEGKNPTAPSSSPITTPSLARPQQPQQRPSPTGLQISTSANPSPAFLRPPAQKDPTPSLSRLQGRGFVQSRVKLSGELQAAATGTQSPDRPSSGGRKASVLDRWQPGVTASPPQSGLPSPSPVRRSKTVDPSDEHSSVSTNAAPSEEKVKSLKSVASLPQISQTGRMSGDKSVPAPHWEDEPPLINTPKPITQRPPHVLNRPNSWSNKVPSTSQPRPSSMEVQATRNVQDAGLTRSSVNPSGLGSSTTLISYIKPSKTGDNSPPPKPRTAAAAGGVNELGVRTRNDRDLHEDTVLRAKPGAPAGRPLSHLTKDRAKPPRRSGNSTASTHHHAEEPSRLVITPEIEPDPGVTSIPLPLVSEASRTFDFPVNPSNSLPISSLRQTEDVSSHNVTGPNVRQLRDSWADQVPIGIKPVVKPSVTHTTSKPASTAASSKLALPGLASPSPPITPPLTVKEEPKSPAVSPTRHTRIPSTGSRLTVMDVAQALSEHSRQFSQPSSSPTALESQGAEDDGVEYGRDDLNTQTASWSRTVTPASVQAERRRSTYEKYSAIIMPPLKEEKTPAQTPVATLSKSASANTSQKESDILNAASQPLGSTDRRNTETYIDHDDKPLPSFDIKTICDNEPTNFAPNPDLHTVSVEVINVVGSAATTISDNAHIFYDGEILAIVHRAKSRSLGLVTTNVWSWRGLKSQAGVQEERRLQELAKRFNSNLQTCDQYNEPQELLHLLGGTLIIRQGTRSLWSAENTTMHVIRSWRRFTVIEEIDLNVRNLCSGFSYCISILNTLRVWHGRGSIDAERQAANAYAQTLTGNDKDVQQVEEGQEDEMFWMFLGKDGYASADHWKWKRDRGMGDTDPRIWIINSGDGELKVREIDTFRFNDDSIHLISLAYETFVLVGSKARGSRTNIRLALAVAQALSSHMSKLRPFESPVHVIILPSQLPLDLCAAVRGLKEDTLNSTAIPQHMNILTLQTAIEHLDTRNWKSADLQDENMLPLGVHPTSLEFDI